MTEFVNLIASLILICGYGQYLINEVNQGEKDIRMSEEKVYSALLYLLLYQVLSKSLAAMFSMKISVWLLTILEAGVGSLCVIFHFFGYGVFERVIFSALYIIADTSLLQQLKIITKKQKLSIIGTSITTIISIIFALSFFEYNALILKYSTYSFFIKLPTCLLIIASAFHPKNQLRDIQQKQREEHLRNYPPVENRDEVIDQRVDIEMNPMNNGTLV
ncbi:hypothetical protein CRE_01925 [Caenorhabditis remanei]|uniref:Uncharacterized protein n=2 Tax=Caenorhabditis remanei TaxID=31234 RepID=E3LGC3_CAERE|nr:hypothetical protein CRE_01925 [Caenorhabditis remanei]